MAGNQASTMKSFNADSLGYGVSTAESIYTYTTTTSSLDDEQVESPIEVVKDRQEEFPSKAIPSTAPSFGDIFPSTTRLLIKHDDTTRDGNMNLRINTFVPQPRKHQLEIILFHFRMYDLHNRKFSFRRYSRESGREVCHSSMKCQNPNIGNLSTAHRRSGNPLFNFRSNTDVINSISTAMKRRDSGYKSGIDESESIYRRKSSEFPRPIKNIPSANTILLEFSNYAHVDLERRGSKTSKRYDFEYWSTKYQWRRCVRNDGDSKEISFHLYHSARSKPVAYIIPEPMTRSQIRAEEQKGGWIPPSSMWINDPTLFEKMKDVADVIVATGLVALVDDYIERRWHSDSGEGSRSISPMTSSFMRSMESIASTKLIDKVFHRRNYTGSKNIDPSRPRLPGIGQRG